MSKRIHCALCIHCKVFNVSHNSGGTYIRKVRCAKDQWPKKSGKSMTYDLHTLRKRRIADCEFYEPDKCEESNESEQAILDGIFAALPAKREILGGDEK